MMAFGCKQTHHGSNPLQYGCAVNRHSRDDGGWPIFLIRDGFKHFVFGVDCIYFCMRDSACQTAEC